MDRRKFLRSCSALSAAGFAANLDLLSLTAHAQTADAGDARPLPEVVRQPLYLIAVGAAVVSYAVMSFVMTATPISMHVMDGHGEVATARVIQVHLLAMYLPSLASGFIISRFGDLPVIVAGTVLVIVCVVIAAFAGHAVLHYGSALLLLGVGRPHERVQAQTLNDFLVFGAQATASLMAGLALATIGWKLLNLATLPLLVAVLASVVLLRRPAT